MLEARCLPFEREGALQSAWPGNRFQRSFAFPLYPQVLLRMMCASLVPPRAQKTETDTEKRQVREGPEEGHQRARQRRNESAITGTTRRENKKKRPSTGALRGKTRLETEKSPIDRKRWASASLGKLYIIAAGSPCTSHAHQRHSEARRRASTHTCAYACLFAHWKRECCRPSE